MIIGDAFSGLGILFGDEPTGALNLSATKEVMDILNKINGEGTTILLVTHDTKVAARADKVIYLEDGSNREICRLGKAQRFLYNCKCIIAKCNDMRGQVCCLSFVTGHYEMRNCSEPLSYIRKTAR